MKKIFFLIIFLGLFTPVFFVSAATVSGYAWSNKIGWINFGCSECNVQVTNKAVTGYAWSENYGWINLNPHKGGIKNNAGVLSGTAWGENLGWIYFSGPNNGNTNVNINSQGQFTGTAYGDIAGTIAFSNCGPSCVVQTDWRPANCGDGACNGSETCNTCPSDCTTCRTTTGANNILATSNKSVSMGLSILINEGATKTNNASVKVALNAGPDASQVELSSDPIFLGSIPEVYEPIKSFVLSPTDGKKIIYARFFYRDGIVSPTVSSSIILDTQPPEINISQLKDSYGLNEDIIVSGTVSEPSEIMFYWDNQYGLVNSNSNGFWIVNFGKIQPGISSINVTAEDKAGNFKNTIIKIKVSNTKVANKNFNIFFKKNILDKIITVSKEIPDALNNKWNLLPTQAQK